MIDIASSLSDGIRNTANEFKLQNFTKYGQISIAELQQQPVLRNYTDNYLQLSEDAIQMATKTWSLDIAVPKFSDKTDMELFVLDNP